MSRTAANVKHTVIYIVEEGEQGKRLVYVVFDDLSDAKLECLFALKLERIVQNSVRLITGPVEPVSTAIVIGEPKVRRARKAKESAPVAKVKPPRHDAGEHKVKAKNGAADVDAVVGK